jgi:Tol biopolymer transport system component
MRRAGLGAIRCRGRAAAVVDPPRDPSKDGASSRRGRDEPTQDVAESLRGDVVGADPQAWPGRPLLVAGQEVADRFRIVRLIARGGMGEIYEADDLDLEVTVALKVLRSSLAADPLAVENLRHEIHLARQVAHPNVCRVFDVFRLRLEDRPAAAIGFTMELLHGETLAERLAERGRLSPDEALPLIRQMAAALDAAHRAGVVHRDFKSANVLLVDDGSGGDRAVVTDFGVARPLARTGDDDAAREDRILVVGTAEYMSPEQAQGVEVDARADIYALGVVLFEMLTGARPHEAETPMALLLKRIKERAPSPRLYLPGLDRQWERAVLLCLERDPARRPASAGEVVRLLGGTPLEAVGGSGRDEASELVAVAPDSRVDLRPPHRRGWWVRGLAIAAAVVLVGAVLWLVGEGRQPATTGHAPAPLQLTTWRGLEVDPAMSPDGGAVAFSANRDGRFEIYIKPLAPGSRETALTADRQNNFQPDWSPDGRWIAYASHGRGGIWVHPSTGGQPRRLTDFGSHPSWSPDGSMVVFQEEASAELNANSVNAFPPSTLWLVRLDGGEPWRLTTAGQPVGGHGDPRFSPDGRRVVFTVSDRRWSQIWSVAIDGSQLRSMVVDPPLVFDPVCSRDGRWLYFAAVSAGERYGLWRLALSARTGLPTGAAAEEVRQSVHSMRHFALAPDGRSLVHTGFGTVSNLVSLPISPSTGESLGEVRALTDGSGRTSRPVFSPDGRWIAFDRWSLGVSQDIWLIRPDGSDERQLTLHPANDSQASWTPDGRAVVFCSERNKQWSLYAARLDGGTEECLAVLDPTFDNIRLSPDGTTIAYHAPSAEGPINIWLAAVDGSGARQITHDQEYLAFPCWSPDGRALAAEHRSGLDDHLMLVAADGTSVRSLVTAPGKHWPYSWSPDGRRIAAAVLRDGFWNVFWIDRETGEERQLTDYRQLTAYVRWPAWSPRGDQIVYEYAETVGDLWLLEGLQPE